MKTTAKVLTANQTDHSAPTQHTLNDDFNVPSLVEDSLEDIFSYLQARDTVVRWSAAKGLSRISERLPRDFADQVLDTLIGLFEIHAPGEGEGEDEEAKMQLPASAEGTWHGACLAIAEFARRDLISAERLSDVLRWMSRVSFRLHVTKSWISLMSELIFRHYILTFVKALTRWVPASETQRHTSSGR